eukprot:comp23757_c0_seq1/m.41099 comp23757_c0_seq1/g.41099  ORF comp23757_c0_seq1/g.41099 comp23757_c0_seq1/m.41099 type:complete len:716 (-) comp23757_c0_seq1:393-2540(-)
MKFGKHLLASMPEGWRFNFLNYNGLKHFLKENTKRREASWDDTCEAKFIVLLDQELLKVSEFSQVKYAELSRHISDLQDRLSRHGPPTSTDERNRWVEELDEVSRDVTTLGKYNNLNYTGLMKIVKKHDKYTSYNLKYTFMARLQSYTFYKESLDPLMTPLGAIYEIVKARSGTDPEHRTQHVKRNYRYWVHPENITELKMAILRHLPVVAYRQREEGPAETHATISSVYLDTKPLDLYHGNLARDDNALSIRCRWYGSQPKRVYIERQSFHEDRSGADECDKAHFSIKDKYVGPYIRGEFTLDQREAKYRSEGSEPHEVDEMLQLAREIQSEATTRQLQPTLRTTFTRTGFQQPSSSRVRVYLDTHIGMIREVDRISSGWHRTDTSGSYPFTDLPANDVTLFPYAVLEIKVRVGPQEEVPKWVSRLINSGLVEPAPHFSKYVHGCAVLLDDRVRSFPSWLPSIVGGMPSNSKKSAGKMGLGEEEEEERDDSGSGPEYARQGSMQYNAPCEDLGVAEVARPEGYTAINVEPRGSIKDKSLQAARRQSAETTPLLRGTERRQPLRLLTRIKQWGRTNSTEAAAAQRIRFSKPIAIPVRVEPKVFYANERTFLNWLHIAVLITTMAIAMLELSQHKSGRAAKWAGLTLGPVAVVFLVYALYTYFWRDMKIRTRDPGPYNTNMGPIVVTSVFIAVLVINYVVWIYEHGLNPDKWVPKH